MTSGRVALPARKNQLPEIVSVAKLRFRRAGRRSLQGRKVSAVYKAAEGIPRRATRRPKFRLVSSPGGGGECCSQWVRSRRGGDKSVFAKLLNSNNNKRAMVP